MTGQQGAARMTIDEDTTGVLAGPAAGEAETVPEFTVATEIVQGWAVLSVGGEVDAYTADELDRVVGEVVQRGHARLVLDLERVTFLDSAGLRVLVAAQRLVGDRDGAMRLVGANTDVLRVFRVSGLQRTFDLRATRREALSE
jgi:anti-sigma B factor antagonist